MCGLIGLIDNFTESNSEYLAAIRMALQEQIHRGPDQQSVQNHGKFTAGFARLSIVDLEGSPQPQRWGPPQQQNRYTAIFNGEIYNYKQLRNHLKTRFGTQYSTQGEAEVLIAAYHHLGKNMLSELKGMFAFLIWDSATEKLFGARDHFGIKPLYITQNSEYTAFSSESKSLSALNRNLKPLETNYRGNKQTAKLVFRETKKQNKYVNSVTEEQLSQYLYFQYVPEPKTLDAAIQKIAPGTAFEVNSDGNYKDWKYFEPTFSPIQTSRKSKTASHKNLVERISEVLDDSVKAHLQADVPVGSFLSGGIDSAAIVSIASKYAPDLTTYTAGFEAQGYSEIEVAAETARVLDLEHKTVIVSMEDVIETLPKIVTHLADPVADPALVPLYFVAQEAAKDVKVVLSGEGADELFGGYNIYREPSSLKLFSHLPKPMRRLSNLLSQLIPAGIPSKSLLHRGSQTLEERYYGNARNFTADQVQKLLASPRLNTDVSKIVDPLYARSKCWDPVARMQHIDIHTWLTGDILLKADRMTMAHSLELRTPFLDRDVFEVAKLLPQEMKISPKTTKLALRQALSGIVPEHVVQRRKLGFPVPVRKWLRTSQMRSWVEQIISAAETDHLINKQTALKLIKEHYDGRADHSRKIWVVLIFSLWHQHFAEDRPG